MNGDGRTIEVCREFLQDRCKRSEGECRYAHPPSHIEVFNGRVTCCVDWLRVSRRLCCLDVRLCLLLDSNTLNPQDCIRLLYNLLRLYRFLIKMAPKRPSPKCLCKWQCPNGMYPYSYIHSFIQAISIAPLQVHYYSEVLPTKHEYCVRVSHRSATTNCE